MIKKLKVCHFTYSFLPLVGGMEEVIHNISVSMLSQGCEPYVFAPYVRDKDNRLDVPYKVLRYQRPSSRRFGLRQLLVPLLWHHMKHRFDIIHCHGVYPPGYVGASFHKITGVPFVITPHGGDIEENNNGIIINSRITARIKKTFASAQAVTAISSDIRDRVLKLGAPQDKIHVIPNGVFTDDFKTASMCHRGKTHDDPYILYLGGLRKIKGIDILLQAFSIINNKYPGLKLKIAGEGKEMNNLKAQADRLGISKDVDFLGMVRRDKKTCLLQNALFAVLSSRSEGFPVIILEAFASGIPVIASRVGGIPDIVKDGENGFLVSPEDANELAGKMAMLMDKAFLRDQFGNNALVAASSYNWLQIVKQYISLYMGLSNKR